MKNYILILVNMAMMVQIYGQTYVDKKGNTHLWGEVTVDDLARGEFEDWYDKNEKDYETRLTKDDGSFLKNTKVKVFLGTWCGDTKYLVPKFIKTWNQMGLKISDLELIALHHEDDNYKQGPRQETIGYNIHKVPTMVFERDGKEIGRIVERTVFDLDTDMMQIAKGNPYEERYQGVATLDKIMKEEHIDSLFEKEKLNMIFGKVRREVATSSEFNAYGYVLKAQGELRKAEFVFLLNKYMFSFNPNVRDSFGEILMAQERWSEAKVEYDEVIRLKGSDENAIRQLSIIYKKLEECEVSKDQ